MRRIIVLSIAISTLLVGCGDNRNQRHLTKAAGLAACEQGYKDIGGNVIRSVADVKDWGDEKEFYFAWGGHTNASAVRTKNGLASGSCIITKATGVGTLTLNSNDLGEFHANLGH